MHKYDKEFWKIPELTAGLINRQIQEHITEAIVIGLLKPGDQIPAHRSLADFNNVNRSPVRRAYLKLQELGWLQSELGSGTFISLSFPGHQDLYPSSKFIARMPLRIHTQNPAQQKKSVQNFVTMGFNTLSPRFFPARQFYAFMDVHRKRYENFNQMQQVIDMQGLEYKDCILNYLNTQRQLAIKSENLQVIIGRRESLNAVFKTLLRPGDEVLNTSAEDLLLKEVLNECGVGSVALNIGDPHFMEKLEELLGERTIKAVYIRPQCSYPDSYHLAVKDCQQLIKLAKAHKFYIIEEDDYHEFWYKLPFKPLVRYDHEGYVIYLGALSQLHVYLQSTRILIAAAEFIDAVRDFGIISPPYRDLLAEKSFIDLIESGKLAESIRKARLQKRADKDACYMTLSNYLDGLAVVNDRETGLSLWLVFQSDQVLIDSMAGLEATGFSVPYHPDGQRPSRGISTMSVGFGSWDLEEAESGAKALQIKFR